MTYPPFEYKTPSGEPTGVDVDLAQALAAELGRELKLESLPFEGLIPSLQSGKIDLAISGMTATADIRVAESKDVFLVPTAALRFDPAKAAKQTGPAKKSFVQSLIPMPTRNSRRPGIEDADAKPATAQIWVLRNGRAESIAVKTGLSDGRHTEVSGEGLSEGLPVITRTSTPAA